MNQFDYAKIDVQPKYPFNPSQQASSTIASFRQTKLYGSQRVVVAKIPNIGYHYICGPASKYSEEYPVSLTPFVTKDEFKTFIGEINTAIEKYWPCTFSFFIAYGFCIISCFLSLFLPKTCIDDVAKFVNYVLERWNETWNPRGVFVDWKRTCTGSFFEFSVKDNIFQRIMTTTNSPQGQDEVKQLTKHSSSDQPEIELSTQ